MGYRLIPVLVTIGIVLIGFIYRATTINSLNKRREFTVSFRNSFIELVNTFFKSGKLSNQEYIKCIHDIDAIQEELGDDGVIAHFIDQSHGMQGHNYQLFMNIIPEMRSAERMTDNDIVMERISQLIGMCDDSLLRHVGNIERKLDAERRGLFNPISCFGEGVRFIVGLPIDILSWCGLIRTSRIDSVRGSWLFKILSGIVTLIGLVGSIITIALGWDEASALITRFLSFLH